MTTQSIQQHQGESCRINGKNADLIQAHNVFLYSVKSLSARDVNITYAILVYNSN